MGKKDIVCSKCGGRGHYASECPSEAGAQYQSPAGSQKGKDKGKDKGKGKKFQGTCSNCGAYGHKRADCWKRIAGVEEYDLPSVSGGGPSIIPPSTAAPSLSGFDERIRSVKSSIFAVRAFKVNEPELILIDSGADIHVCPLSFAGGVDSHEPVPLRDIGGKTLVSHGRKGIGLDIGGSLIVDFAVANVETAVLSVGQLSDKEIDFQVMNGKGSLVNRATGRVTPLVKFGKTYYLSRARSRIAAVGMAVNMDVEPAVGRDVPRGVVHYFGEGEHQRAEPAEGEHQRAGPAEGEQQRAGPAEGERQPAGPAEGAEEKVYPFVRPSFWPRGLAPWDSVKKMRDYLSGVGAPIWGTKEIMWERILNMEKIARGERAFQKQYAEELQKRTDGQEAIVPAQLVQPDEPSEQERREHELTHVPSKPWCRWCQMGKSRQLPHRAIMVQDREPGLPRIEVDYGILKVSEEDGRVEGPRAWATFLMAVHVGTGMSLAVPM